MDVLNENAVRRPSATSSSSGRRAGRPHGCGPDRGTAGLRTDDEAQVVERHLRAIPILRLGGPRRLRSHRTALADHAARRSHGPQDARLSHRRSLRPPGLRQGANRVVTQGRRAWLRVPGMADRRSKGSLRRARCRGLSRPVERGRSGTDPDRDLARTLEADGAGSRLLGAPNQQERRRLRPRASGDSGMACARAKMR